MMCYFGTLNYEIKYTTTLIFMGTLSYQDIVIQPTFAPPSKRHIFGRLVMQFLLSQNVYSLWQITYYII